MTLPIKYTDAAILVNQNRKLVIDKVQLPEKLGIGQVLVEVHVSGHVGMSMYSCALGIVIPTFVDRYYAFCVINS